MPTEISHQATGVKYNWTFNQDVETGTFWDGSPYVIAKPGLKLLSCNMDTADGILEPNTIIPDLELGFLGKEGFKGELYINGLAKNPNSFSDFDKDGNKRASGNQFDNRDFGTFNKGWTQFKQVRDPVTKKNIKVPIPTSEASSYGDFSFNLPKFMEMHNAIRGGGGVDLESGDVMVLQYSNYDINCPWKWNISYSGGYPYQKVYSRSCAMSYGTLFVLDAHPTEVCFRPPVLWPEEDRKNRPLHSVSKINDKLPMGDELVVNPIANPEHYNKPPTYENHPGHKTFCYAGFAFGTGTTYSQMMPLLSAAAAGTTSKTITADNAISAYGAYYQSPLLSRVKMLYSQNVADHLRLEALRVVVQWGIDAFGAIKSYSQTAAGAGQKPCVSRPWSILAGYFLNQPEMQMPESIMVQDTKRFAGFLSSRNDPNNSKVITIENGVHAGKKFTLNEWHDMMYGDSNTLIGQKRLLAKFTSMEGTCYFQVVDDPNNIPRHYDNVGESHRRKFGGENCVFTNTTPTDKVPLPRTPASAGTQTFNMSGNFAKMHWMDDFPVELKPWGYSHDGKTGTFYFLYMRVTEGAGAGDTLYRVINHWGNFRDEDPSSMPNFTGYGFVFDRPWQNGIPDATSKFELLTTVRENVGDAFYVISPQPPDYPMRDGNLSPSTPYADICEDSVLTLYGWMNYIKLKTGANPDFDTDSTHAHRFAHQITSVMPYNLTSFNTHYWINGLRPWEMAVTNMWYGKPLNTSLQAIAKSKDFSKFPNITHWCNIPIAAASEELVGDFNNDGVVDGQDMALLLARWGSKDSSYDLDKDGAVDAADLAILQSNWGKKKKT